MNRQKILFLGSKPIGYYCLKHLIEHQDALNIDIQGILTNDNPRFNPDLSIGTLALEHQIPLIVKEDDMPETDYIISVQYHNILTKQQIAKAKKLAVNLHMAPLPEYRGCNQFSFAIVDRAKEFGTTLHVMDEGIDHGDLLFENRFTIPEHCWVDQLYHLTYDASLALFKDSISLILNEQYQRIPQSSLIPQRGTSLHFRKEMNSIKQIDLDWDAEKIERHIRASYMPGFEPPYCMIQGQKIYFEKTWVKK